jgi:Asp-tRNA(Asn)/Glu-tRNA(Gln) amidotransferase A subunit family amidase
MTARRINVCLFMQVGGRVPLRSARKNCTDMANVACYPALAVPNGFAESGSPGSITFHARPFGEAELLALAKAYQDASGFHLKHPALA